MGGGNSSTTNGLSAKTKDIGRSFNAKNLWDNNPFPSTQTINSRPEEKSSRVTRFTRALNKSLKPFAISNACSSTERDTALHTQPTKTFTTRKGQRSHTRGPSQNETTHGPTQQHKRNFLGAESNRMFHFRPTRGQKRRFQTATATLIHSHSTDKQQATSL